jgi:DNA repair protein RadC
MPRQRPAWNPGTAIAVPHRSRFAITLNHDLKTSLGPERCPVLLSPEQVAGAFADLALLDREVLLVATLDCKCRLLHWGLLAVGSSDLLVVRLGEAFQGAIRHAGSGIVLVHNHPSGSLTPSRHDMSLTRRAAEAGRLLGYPLLDHVIVSRKGFRSLCRARTLGGPISQDAGKARAGPLVVRKAAEALADRHALTERARVLQKPSSSGPARRCGP